MDSYEIFSPVGQLLAVEKIWARLLCMGMIEKLLNSSFNAIEFSWTEIGILSVPVEAWTKAPKLPKQRIDSAIQSLVYTLNFVSQMKSLTGWINTYVGKT